ncbi:Phosphatidylinositol N-acetylglucosaminyltransferase subunit P [Rhynchospora pubera]|uniref:Phosphatidylinositol N-acetylglucosaminyltransferase subunit P n=1 Tax=Rhynchospora pubera TaxID=906938 RepID=A0AAV8BXL2_9POAL|nr:Phosphatidylinositol N-acetylglucosaminyltransferase subunit P [Rhynchospora pubera]
MDEGPGSPTTLVVSSPRRTLSLLRERRASDASSLSLNHEKRTSAAPLAGDHGPKPSEVYGFVGSITTVIATAIYLVWAYTPQPWLHSLGITYYPSKYWALAVPSFVTMSVFLMIVLYLGLNFLATPPSYSPNTIYDEYSQEPTAFTLFEGMEKPIDPISDVGIDQINHLMFSDTNQ